MNKILILVILGLLGVSFLSNFYFYGRLKNLEAQILTKNKASHDWEEQEEEFELAEKMMFLQRYSEKLYFAAKKQNWELADFYLEELEETVEKVIKANKMEDGINVSSQMREMLYPKIKDLQEKLKSKAYSEFDKSYNAMLMNCNGCHMLTKHGFIKVQVPRQNYYSQEF